MLPPDFPGIWNMTPIFKEMMVMAREGYHPDYVFTLHHMLRATTGSLDG
jgi:hypothetical protein